MRVIGAFELAAVCVLFSVGALTSLFFPRLNFSSDTRVPVLIFKFISLGSI